MKKLKVQLGKDSYTILIGQKIISTLVAEIRKKYAGCSIHIITNTTVAKHYRSSVSKKLAAFKPQWIELKDGEQYKTLQSVEDIYHQLITQGANRKSVLIALGGGVVGDICGFVAATYLRGIPFIQVPTTLLAQVDSSVGGKTGVDLPEGKNLIGAFYQPKLVLIDTDFLKTLPKRELICGFSEVIKYGILWDADFFKFLEQKSVSLLKLNPKDCETIIERSCAIKALIVSRDEKENGLRALLNLGHTLGHAIETLSGYSKYLHGEGVAMGMVYAALLSKQLGYLSAPQVNRITDLITSFGLPTHWPRLSSVKYRQAIERDKKSIGKKINYVAIKKIGRAFLLPLSPQEIVRYI